MRISTSPHTPKDVVAIQADATRTDTRLIEQAEATVLVLGVAGGELTTRRRAISFMRRVVREAKQHRIDHVALDIELFSGASIPRTDLFRLMGENLHLANYEFRTFKAKPKEGWADVRSVALVATATSEEKHALARGEIVAEETNACRDLSNTPGGDMTPLRLAQRIQASARGSGATVRTLRGKDMEALGMGAVLGVARGAKEPPAFIIVEYWGAAKKEAPVVLVGKGVTFDSGGLSLKPADFMLDMHLDMSGGAAVAHAVLAAARLKLAVNVVALIPAVENAVSGESYRPGDVLRSMSGKTIDILNTDAEGRVIMADALTYAKRYKPQLTVDVATLTGAALVALGTKASAVLSPDAALAARICTIGEESGEYGWPLPMWEEYKGMVKGRFGDVANVPTEQARYAGTIGGAMFLAEFAEGPWVHIDMAPRMTSDSSDYLAPGAAGAPVRLLVRLLEHGTRVHEA